MRYLFKEGAIQDGILKGCGRIVIHNGEALMSHNNQTDHNDLLRGFVSRFRMPKDEVINAVRLYFKYEGDAVIIAGVRQIDNEAVKAHLHEYGKIIAKLLS